MSDKLHGEYTLQQELIVSLENLIKDPDDLSKKCYQFLSDPDLQKKQLLTEKDFLHLPNYFLNTIQTMIGLLKKSTIGEHDQKEVFNLIFLLIATDPWITLPLFSDRTAKLRELTETCLNLTKKPSKGLSHRQNPSRT